MFIEYNQNTCKKRTIDCTVRALATLLGESWDNIYVKLCLEGFELCDMPSSKAVVDSFLFGSGYAKRIPPNGITVRDFSERHPRGRYLLATDSHVVPVISGNYIDTWDSGQEIPLFYWEENNAI